VRDDGKIKTLQDFKGQTIGVKGDIPPSIVAMLAQAGLKRGVDYKEVLLDGFDPVAHLKTSIDALPVYKSNEPGQLDRAGVTHKLFDPIDYGVPGSFGIFDTTPDFLSKHPAAAQDFVRAASTATPTPCATPPAPWPSPSRRSTPPGRWGSSTPPASPTRSIRTAKAGVFTNGTPKTDGSYDPSVAAGAYQNGALVWPTA
jgi:hypothetical protein